MDGTTVSTSAYLEEFETALVRDGVVTVVERYLTDLEASIGHRRWCSYISAFLTATGARTMLPVQVEGKTRRRFALREDV